MQDNYTSNNDLINQLKTQSLLKNQNPEIKKQNKNSYEKIIIDINNPNHHSQQQQFPYESEVNNKESNVNTKTNNPFAHSIFYTDNNNNNNINTNNKQANNFQTNNNHTNQFSKQLNINNGNAVHANLNNPNTNLNMNSNYNNNLNNNNILETIRHNLEKMNIANQNTPINSSVINNPYIIPFNKNNFTSCNRNNNNNSQNQYEQLNQTANDTQQNNINNNNNNNNYQTQPMTQAMELPVILNTANTQNYPNQNYNQFIPQTIAVEENDNDGKHLCLIIALTVIFGFFAGFYFYFNFKKIKRKELAVGTFLCVCFITTIGHVLYFLAFAKSSDLFD